MACSCAACTQPDCTRTGCRRTSYTYETYPTGMAGYVSPTRGKVSKDTEGGSCSASAPRPVQKLLELKGTVELAAQALGACSSMHEANE